jgi:hypothetical protein
MVIFIFLGCNNFTVIKDEYEIVDTPHEPCISKPAPIYLPGEMLFGRVSGLKNCLPFMASASASLGVLNGSPIVGLFITTYEDWGGGEFVGKENIHVGVIASGLGTFSMYNPSTDEYIAGYGTFQDFDVFEDIFKMDENYPKNEITLTLLDKSEGHIQGYFNARFLLASSMPSGHNPDTVIFTNCYFDAWKR